MIPLLSLVPHFTVSVFLALVAAFLVGDLALEGDDTVSESSWGSP